MHLKRLVKRNVIFVKQYKMVLTAISELGEEQGSIDNTVRVPWTARRSNQSILKEINLEYSVEGLMLKLKLSILWPPDVKN